MSNLPSWPIAHDSALDLMYVLWYLVAWMQCTEGGEFIPGSLTGAILVSQFFPGGHTLVHGLHTLWQNSGLCPSTKRSSKTDLPITSIISSTNTKRVPYWS